MKNRLTVLLFFVLLPYLAFAASGKIKGKVTDLTSGEPLIGANILVLGTSFGAATDVNGNYTILNLDAGTYEVRASFVGYQTVTYSNIRVNTELTTELDFELPSEGIELQQVNIIAQRPLIQKDNTNATRTISSDDIESLPVRGVTNLIGFSAGVVLKDNQVFIRGGRLDEVGFYLEGINIRNPLSGGRGVNISQDAVEEIQVQAGGYTAEFGGANAGIVRQQLKTGSQSINASFEYITDNISFKSKDDIFDGEKRLGTHWYGYNEMSGILSGPIFSPKYRFFYNFNYLYQRDQNPQPYPGINLGNIVDVNSQDSINLYYPAGPVDKNSLDRYTHSGTISLDFSPIKLRFAGTYSDSRSDIVTTSTPQDAPITPVRNFLNPRVGERDINDGSFSAKLTHVVSKDLFYELTGGFNLQKREDIDPYLKDDFWSYGDSVANANVGWVWQRSVKDVKGGNVGRYVTPSPRNLFQIGFANYGEVPVNYLKRDNSSFEFTGGLTLLTGGNHTIKLGGSYQQYTLRNWSVGNQDGFAQKIQTQQQADPTKSLAEIKKGILITEGVNNYGYDIFGNKLDDDEFFGPHKPVYIGAYLQDKIEFDDIILNAGLRFDYIDIDNKELKDATDPDAGVTSAGEIKPEGWQDVPSFNAVSPRIGLSFPVTDKTVFHAQFGKFVQQSRGFDIYQGWYRFARELKGGNFFPSPVGKNIAPTRTTQYELGFTQLLTDFLSFDITGYYRDVKDQVVYINQSVKSGSNFQSYNTLANGDFATTKGIEISFNMRRYERILANANLSFQDAQGTGSFPNSNRGIVGSPLDGVTVFNPVYITPLEYNNSLRGGVNVDYRFGANDGPSLLHDFGVSVLATFTSGHPYTRGVGGVDLEGDARNRRPVEPLNASTTPPTFQVDLRIDKTFNIFDRLSANIYVFVINLFDAKNIENVFLRTGAPNDDGYISNPELSAQLTQTYGDPYVAVWRAINIDYYEQYQNAGSLQTVPYFYGPPRQIRLGIKLSY